MSALLHHTLFATAATSPERSALVHDRAGTLDFATTATAVEALAARLIDLGIAPNDRVAIYLPKVVTTPVAFYAATLAGGVFVPVNPVLKAPQVAHILADCNVRVLVTSPDRLKLLQEELAPLADLRHVILTDEPAGFTPALPYAVWDPLRDGRMPPAGCRFPRRIDADMAAILYTSGSTGKPKGVILSHRNVVTGAESVAEYLEIGADDRLLAVLPFSFDYGMNQLTTCMLKGATCVLFDYLLPRDVLKAVAKHRITGLAAVPPLWAQVAALEWPAEAKANLRYITNSGGHMPDQVLQRLREELPGTRPFLMYGLTEAFRSTYLPPEKIDERRGSIGKAIPNAEIMVVNAEGQPVGPREHGELVHRGSLVALGYWNDEERTSVRFRPAPHQPAGIPTVELAVWSGDTVWQDEEGYLYFVGRDDGMIKSSGYRISPEEIEEVAYGTGMVAAAAAIGVPHETLGHAIVLVVSPAPEQAPTPEALLEACRRQLPNFMHPAQVVISTDLPLNPNGKINRRQLTEDLQDLYGAAAH
ncbi:MAG: acyl-CoA ligase (AMP-forming), exosortase A system-associated [Gammaproteobacteria bacterium]|nr:acyl-CoA ligase (AMP-forming), exosortase A system-associated [Gammaproteobacteria bacterium]MBI5618889.1 acyl-CoA ligase (AMP-forming), exosortase A system-associated [Gammaproteobacteria bacterium]